MSAFALAVVCWKYGVEMDRVLSACVDESGAVTAVIDNGIAGSPKVRICPEEVESARAEIARAGSADSANVVENIVGENIVGENIVGEKVAVENDNPSELRRVPAKGKKKKG